MDFMTALDIGASALSADRTALNVTAMNLANAKTTRTAHGGYYRRKTVIRAATEVDSPFSKQMQSSLDRELRGVRVSPVKGDTATAQATVYDHGSERNYPVQLGLKLQPEGYWKVTDVKNMAELIRKVRKEAEER